MPVIGFLSSGSLGPIVELVSAFRRGLTQVRYVEGQNVTIEYRFAEGHYERLPALATELVGRRVTLIASVGGTVVAQAAKGSTAKSQLCSLSAMIPSKLVSSRVSIGRRATSQESARLQQNGAKRVELLHEMLPHAKSAAFLVNPTNPSVETDTKRSRQRGTPWG